MLKAIVVKSNDEINDEGLLMGDRIVIVHTQDGNAYTECGKIIKIEYIEVIEDEE